MKKGRLITSLWAVFFIPAFANIGNSACSNKRGSAVSGYTHTHAYAKIVQDQLPAILASCQFYPAANTGVQKIINFPEPGYSGLNYFLRCGTSTMGVDELSLQKKYLFYIYPSHNFW